MPHNVSQPNDSSVKNMDDMTWDKWQSLPECERDAMRDNSQLTPQLIGLEGWRVDVVDADGCKPRRFIVGKSMGWRPRHLELLTVRSIGGEPARQCYVSVRKVEKIR